MNGNRPTPTSSQSPCYQGYCEFVRCVRGTNANTLIDGCFIQNLIGRDFTRNPDRVSFYTNVTSCVLSRARCNTYNPITGELQLVQQPPNQQVPISARFSMYNALQITPAGDIRIVTFPGTTGVAEFFCSTRSTLEQDSFDNADCWLWFLIDFFIWQKLFFAVFLIYFTRSKDQNYWEIANAGRKWANNAVYKKLRS